MTQPLLQLDTMRRPWIDDAVDQFPRIAYHLLPEWTSDDLHRHLPEPPEKNAWGSLLARLKKSGVIRKVGYRVSERPSANCRPVSLWKTV